MKKRILIYYLFAIIFGSIFLPLCSSAFEMVGGHNQLSWEPGLKTNISFTIHNTEETQEFFLVPFATRDEDLLEEINTMFYFPEPSAIVKFDEYKTFYAQITLPKERPSPGTHRVMIAVDTRAPGGGAIPSGISARINLAYPIIISVPQFGKFIEAQIQQAKDTPKGEDLVFYIKGSSLSTETIEKATGIVDIYNNGTLIDSAIDSIVAVSPGSSFKIYPRLSTDKISVGIYSAKARVLYDGLVANAGEINKFLIGDINVNILNISQNILKKDLINKININAISEWSLELENVYALVELTYENQTKLKIRTESKNLAPQTVVQFPVYIDTTGFGENVYDLKITMYYSDKTSTKTFPIKITSSIDYPAGYENSSSALLISIVALLIIIVALIIAVFSLYLKRLNRQKKGRHKK